MSPPDALSTRSQWVCWREVVRDGKPTKVPVDAVTGGLAASDDPDTWTTYDAAVDYHETPETNTDGIGFMFSAADQLVGIDLDDCYDENGELYDWAQAFVDLLDSYTEISPSDGGDHIIALGSKPGGRCKTDYEDGVVEMYEDGRFFTWTGNHVEGTPQEPKERREEIAAVYTEVFGPDEEDQSSPVSAHSGSSAIPDDDAELLERAQAAENGEKFTRLWEGDPNLWEGGSSEYPSQSEADLALCGLLAFWTGGDHSRMDRLFRSSGLMREKWKRDDYSSDTISKALDGRTEFYGSLDTSRIEPEGEEWPENARTWDQRLTTRLQDARVQERSISVTRHIDDVAGDLLRDFEFITPAGRGDDPTSDPLLVYDANAGHFIREGQTLVLSQLATHAPAGVLSTAAQENVVKTIKRRTSVDRDTLDGGGASQPLINLENGVYDVETGELLEHDPAFRFTACVQAAHDPNASGEAWDSFLFEVTEDEVAVQTLYEWLGVSLTHNVHAQKFLLLHGPGGNGKGVFFDAIKALFATEQVSAVSFNQLTSGGREFGLADLEGSLINIDDDFTSGAIAHEGLNRLLNVTGNGTIQVQRKYGQPFDLDVRTQFMFATNELPRFDMTNSSVARRLLEIKFPFRFTKHDDGHKEYRPRTELMAELTTNAALAGLLNRALEGLHRYRDRGEEFTLEVEWGSTDERFRQYQLDSDPIRAFAVDCLEHTEGFMVTKDSLYNTYKAYCRAYKKTPTGRDAFFRAVNQKTDLALSRYRPRIDHGDGDERPYCYKHIWFTEHGREHVPPGDQAEIKTIARAVCTNRGVASELGEAAGIDFSNSAQPASADGGSQATAQVLAHLEEAGGVAGYGGLIATLSGEGMELGTATDALDELARTGRVIVDDSTVTQS